MSTSSGSVKGRERNGGAVRGGDGKQGEEIASKSLMVQSKRFYLDVKQNDRGRFVKLAEVAMNGRKNRLFMSMRVSKTLKDIIDKWEKEGFTSQSVEHKEGEGKNEAGILHTETIVNDKRRYYVDLRENQRGVFLRITQIEIQSGNRNSIALPVQGIEQFRDALEELIDEYAEGFIDEDVELPESQSLRTDGKNFYFDPGNNPRGDFLKITELKPSIGIRNTIAISVKAIPQFTQIMNKLYDEFQSLRSAEKSAPRASGDNSAAAVENNEQAESSTNINKETEQNNKNSNPSQPKKTEGEEEVPKA